MPAARQLDSNGPKLADESAQDLTQKNSNKPSVTPERSSGKASETRLTEAGGRRR